MWRETGSQQIYLSFRQGGIQTLVVFVCYLLPSVYRSLPDVGQELVYAPALACLVGPRNLKDLVA
jgi:hypothetical protein